MSKVIEVRLNDEAEDALALLCSTGTAQADAISIAIIEAAAHANLRHRVNDSDALETALDKSHDLIAEVLMTGRPPR